MNERLLNQLTRSSLLLLALLCSTPSFGLSTDKDQDLEIESDSAQLDDTKNISIYTGNVVVVQGSMRITGNKMTIYYTDDNKLEKIIMEGQPSTFRQMPDNSTIYDEAEAVVMEYYELNNLIVLKQNAKVKQGDKRLIADHVEYDTTLSQVRANSSTSDAGKPTNEDTRVKLIIPGKKTTTDPTN